MPVAGTSALGTTGATGAPGRPPASADGSPRRRRRREPEKTVLHRVLSAHLETFLERARDEAGAGLPRFVEHELRAYLACGILAHGSVLDAAVARLK